MSEQQVENKVAEYFEELVGHRASLEATLELIKLDCSDKFFEVAAVEIKSLDKKIDRTKRRLLMDGLNEMFSVVVKTYEISTEVYEVSCEILGSINLKKLRTLFKKYHIGEFGCYDIQKLETMDNKLHDEPAVAIANFLNHFAELVME